MVMLPFVRSEGRIIEMFALQLLCIALPFPFAQVKLSSSHARKASSCTSQTISNLVSRSATLSLALICMIVHVCCSPVAASRTDASSDACVPKSDSELVAVFSAFRVL